MGICNVTPDSFSDGGLYADPRAARARVDALLLEGAEVIDIGGESTRPGARPVPAAEQLARILEVVRYTSARVCVSVDTTSPEVALACVEAGAHVINDVSFLSNHEMANVVVRTGAGLILSHAKHSAEGGFGALPYAHYTDVVAEVVADVLETVRHVMSLGVPADALIVDPGLGFSKSRADSLELLSRIAEFIASVKLPVLVGASRKSFLQSAGDDASPDDRIGASIAAAIHAAREGAAMVRVHDVRATRQALAVERALRIRPRAH